MKNNKFLMVFLTVLIAGAVTSCHIGMFARRGNGSVVSEERTAANFTKVELEGVGEVIIYPGQKYNEKDYAVIVKTDSNLQDIIEIDVSGDTLTIERRHDENIRPTKLEIQVYMPALREVDLEGVGDIKIAAGNAEELRLELSGVGDIDASSFEVENVKVYLNGVGDIEVWATQNLSGKLSGIGDIKYKGNPSKDIDESGIGDVRKL